MLMQKLSMQKQKSTESKKDDNDYYKLLEDAEKLSQKLYTTSEL